MFMSTAVKSFSTADPDSDFGLMHLNALNGSSSAISGPRFGPSNYVNDEPASCSGAQNSSGIPFPTRLCSKDSLKVPTAGRLRPTSPHQLMSRSKGKSPYLVRRTAKTNRYEAEVHSISDGTAENNFFVINPRRDKLEENDYDITPGQEVKVKKRSTYSDIRTAKSLDFDSPFNEKKKSSKRNY